MIFAIGIGTNLGNRIENIKKSINLLEENGIKILKISNIYQTKALVLDDHKHDPNFDIDFFNLAVLCESEKNPNQILSILKAIEKKMGRVDNVKWAPRIIDLDLLLYNSIIIKEKDFTLPHYGLKDRAFVILPLLQIVPDWKCPDNSEEKSISQIYQEKFFHKNDNFINVLPLQPQIMAIINFTNDSFSGDGCLSGEINIEKICAEIWQKFKDGASILDFGAQSTRANAPFISPEDEIKRIKLIMDEFFQNYYSKSKIYPSISIDSYYPKVVEYCIENYKVDIINDVSGLQNIELLDYIINSDRKIVLMHNLGVPPKSNEMIDYSKDPIKVLIEWFENKIEKILDYGAIKKEQIILDPGIGFGKTVNQQWQITNRISELKKKFNLPILFGHSKKSFFKTIASDSRSNHTLGVSLKVANHVNYLRVHDVKLHVEALSGFSF